MPTRKNLKINDYKSILRDFIQFCVGLGFGISKFLQSVVAHPKNLNNSIIDLFYDTLNNFSTVLIFGGFKSGILDFCDAYT